MSLRVDPIILFVRKFAHSFSKLAPFITVKKYWLLLKTVFQGLNQGDCTMKNVMGLNVAVS